MITLHTTPSFEELPSISPPLELETTDGKAALQKGNRYSTKF